MTNGEMDAKEDSVKMDTHCPLLRLDEMKERAYKQ
jgi:hypothetical protein